MEDKKVKAGSVAVGICLFIIAILLVLIVVFFYNTTMEKNNLQAKVSELETTIKEKDNKVNELENKISKVSDVLNTEEKILTEEEAKKLIKEKYELAIDLFLDVGEFEYISDINDSRVIEEKIEGQNYTWHYYPITNYDEIVNEYLSDNIKSYFEEKNSRIITKNEKKYTTDGGVGFISYNGLEEIKVINITDEKLNCIVKIKCADLEGKFTEYRESDFCIIKKGDSWLIEKFDCDKII